MAILWSFIVVVSQESFEHVCRERTHERYQENAEHISNSQHGTPPY